MNTRETAKKIIEINKILTPEMRWIMDIKKDDSGP